MAGEIVQMKEGIRHREEQLNPSGRDLAGTGPVLSGQQHPAQAATARQAVRQRGNYRLIADALRRAEKPLASSDVADAIVEAKGYGRDSIHALTRRVRANLSYLLRNKRVVKTGDRLTARWTLPV
jgi:hypothetical protein